MVNPAPAVNLLPDDVKKAFGLRYYLSLASLLFFLVAVAIAAGGALLAPSYFFAKDSEASAARILDATEKNLGLKEKSGASVAVTVLAERVKALGAYSYRPAVMPVFAAVGGSVPKGVSVRGIKLKETESGKGSVIVSGVAATRASLIAFSNALKAERIFSNVSVPVEQLAGEVNLDFSLTLPYALP